MSLQLNLVFPFRSAQQVAQGSGVAAPYLLTYLDQDMLLGRASGTAGEKGCWVGVHSGLWRVVQDQLRGFCTAQCSFRSCCMAANCKGFGACPASRAIRSFPPATVSVAQVQEQLQSTFWIVACAG
jgi:hypothetical protein